jgi:uncharacterized repeat protein (TIGR03803 family)
MEHVGDSVNSRIRGVRTMKKILARTLGVCVSVAAFSACTANNGAVPQAPQAPQQTRASSRSYGPMTLLYSFCARVYCGDGADPYGGLTADGAGGFYGTTSGGGTVSCGYRTRCGAIFKLTPSGSGYSENVIYNFKGSGNGDGASPAASMIVGGDGSYYGTTAGGGPSGCYYFSYHKGCGTVFKLTPSGSGYTESVLYSFCPGSYCGTDGYYPYGGLTEDKYGDFYGTTEWGGAGLGYGTVYELTPSRSGYTERILHSFQGGRDGGYPYGNVIFGNDGALYGTTSAGGGGSGTIFKIQPSGKGYSIVYKFAGKPDGAAPYAGLTLGANGTFYGTTWLGGSGYCEYVYQAGCGTVFEFTPSGSGYREHVLYSFQGGYDDGAAPWSSLIIGPKGAALYGTTFNGGMGRCWYVAWGCGTVFKLSGSGYHYTEHVLYRFNGHSDGGSPYAGVIFGLTGQLYGAAFSGGGNAGGTIFELKP